jgi:uncharacterized heparinase superfamily protein
LGLPIPNPKESPISGRIDHLSDSGYIRLAFGEAVVILDVAKVGPDYLPGHAHADTLSFEFSLFGHRLIVNGGTSRYGVGPERLRERETFSHSTVEIDGVSSSEVWSGFRVARRAYPYDLTMADLDEYIEVACSHDGYRRLAGKPVHRRSWRLSSCALRVIDQVSGGHGTAVARYHFHPELAVVQLSPQCWQLQFPTGELAIMEVMQGHSQVENAHYAPEFGKSLDTRSLAVALIGGRAEVDIRWN